MIVDALTMNRRRCPARHQRSRGGVQPDLLVGVVIALAVVGAVVAVLLNDPNAKQGSGLGDEFLYDITEHRQVDPTLIQYEEARAFDVGFVKARAITVAKEGRIYVAGDRAITIFKGNGTRVSRLSLSGEPTCVAVAEDGTIYVGYRAAVEVLDSAGTITKQWDIPAGTTEPAVTSIAVSNGDCFVADAGNRVVLYYTTAGSLVRRIGERDESRQIPGFVIPSPYFDLTMAPDGLLRVINPGRHLIEAYTKRGDREFVWGKQGSRIDRFCGCCNPTHIDLLPGGGFVTSEKGLTRVKTYNAAGEFQSVVAGPRSFKEENAAVDLAVDPQGRILVLDPSTRSVRIFTHKRNTREG